MHDNSIYRIIERGIAKQLAEDIDIVPEQRLKEDLGLPSIKLISFLTGVTTQLNLSIFDFADFELLNLKTISDIFQLLSKKIAMKAEEHLFAPDLIIENTDIRLRLVSIQDLPELAKMASDPAIWKFFPMDLEKMEALEKYVINLLTEHANRRNIPFVIIDKKQNNRLAGMSSFGNISFPDKRIEIGWSWLGWEFQGSGINGGYKRLMLEYAFDILHFVRVEFKTDVLNTQARKALLKIGAMEEGILRSHTQMHSNRRRDTIYYSILQHEWELLKEKAHGSNHFAGR